VRIARGFTGNGGRTRPRGAILHDGALRRNGGVAGSRA
jgi:hypothetical protein